MAQVLHCQWLHPKIFWWWTALVVLATRVQSDFADDDVSKKPRTKEAKRQRINQTKMEYAKRLSEVKMAYKEYFTVDDHSTI